METRKTPISGPRPKQAPEDDGACVDGQELKEEVDMLVSRDQSDIMLDKPQSSSMISITIYRLHAKSLFLILILQYLMYGYNKYNVVAITLEKIRRRLHHPWSQDDHNQRKNIGLPTGLTWMVQLCPAGVEKRSTATGLEALPRSTLLIISTSFFLIAAATLAPWSAAVRVKERAEALLSLEMSHTKPWTLAAHPLRRCLIALEC